ncbi:MAG: hypothetical protein ACKVRN_14450 [Pyrinomonadaceae bacterium]
MTVNNSIQTEPEHRQDNRLPSELQTIVQVKESADEHWKEVTKVLTVSKNGAGFCLTRPCVVGRLITLVMPLDPDLRAYDKKNEVYPVMGIVQYCNASTVEGQTSYHVGVGFVGKKVPESFKTDPTQNYRISGMKQDGLWSITEAESQFKNRRQPRYWITLPVTISLLQKSENSGAREETYTKNICSNGVSAVCTLTAGIGEKVKFACKDLNFYSIAIVRNRKTQKDGLQTLHLEFVDNEFPIDEVVATRVAEVATV